MFKFDIEISNVEKINPQFSKCDIWIMYHGQNPNGTDIPKDVAEDAVPSLFNIPIVGEYIEEKEDFGGHGGKIIIEEDSISFVQTTYPYGVVPSDSTVEWRTITDKNGEEKEYLCCSGYLWTGRYPEAQQIIEEGKPQSMELDPNSMEGEWYTTEKGESYFKLSKFVFSAITILGNDKQPAFDSASIGSFYSLSNRKELFSEFELMKEKLRQEFDENVKGGTDMKDKFLKFELSFEGTTEKIFQAVNPRDDDGYLNLKYFVDVTFQDRAILFDIEQGKHYRQKYSVDNNDGVQLGERVEIELVDLTAEERAQLDQIKSEYERLKNIEKEFEEYKKSLERDDTDKNSQEGDDDKITQEYVDKLEKENEELKQFKLEKEREDKENVIKQFEHILEEDEVKPFRDEIDSYSVSSLKEKLAVLTIDKVEIDKFTQLNNAENAEETENKEETDDSEEIITNVYEGIDTDTGDDIDSYVSKFLK